MNMSFKPGIETSSGELQNLILTLDNCHDKEGVRIQKHYLAITPS